MGEEVRAIRVAKVGGSLFDCPDLRPQLWTWIQSRADERVVFIPGGGDAADLVRNLQVAHELDESTAHWLAVRAMSLNAHVLASLLRVSVVTEPGEAATAVLDVHPFLIADEGRPGALEHSCA